MGGMLAAAMRTPILAILLVPEMTNSFSNIYAIGTVTLVAYLVADLLKERRFTILVASHEWSKQSRIGANPLFQTKVPVVANYTDVQLQDLALPDGTLI